MSGLSGSDAVLLVGLVLRTDTGTVSDSRVLGLLLSSKPANYRLVKVKILSNYNIYILTILESGHFRTSNNYLTHSTTTTLNLSLMARKKNLTEVCFKEVKINTFRIGTIVLNFIRILKGYTFFNALVLLGEVILNIASFDDNDYRLITN